MTRHPNTYGYPNYTCDGCGVVAVRKAWRHLRFSTGWQMSTIGAGANVTCTQHFCPDCRDDRKPINMSMYTIDELFTNRVAVVCDNRIPQGEPMHSESRAIQRQIDALYEQAARLQRKAETDAAILSVLGSDDDYEDRVVLVIDKKFINNPKTYTYVFMKCIDRGGWCSTGYVDHPATWISFDQVLQILRKDAESIEPYIVTALSPLA